MTRPAVSFAQTQVHTCSGRGCRPGNLERSSSCKHLPLCEEVLLSCQAGGLKGPLWMEYRQMESGYPQQVTGGFGCCLPLCDEDVSKTSIPRTRQTVRARAVSVSETCFPMNPQVLPMSGFDVFLSDCVWVACFQSPVCCLWDTCRETLIYTGAGSGTGGHTVLTAKPREGQKIPTGDMSCTVVTIKHLVLSGWGLLGT